MKLNFEPITKNLFSHGYALSDHIILTSEELSDLIDRVKSEFSKQTAKIESSNAKTISGLAGIDPKIDYYLEKMLSNDVVRNSLRQILGENYKIWQLNVRWSEIGDPGLSIHQDSFGETNLVFLLSDHKDIGGSTGFLKFSHLIPRWSRKISWSRIGISKHFMNALEGNAGNWGFFFNKTWHGRMPNHGSEKIVILMSFFGEGTQYLPEKPSVLRVRNSQSTSLKALIDIPDSEIDKIYQVKKVTPEIPFSVAIETEGFFSLNLSFLYLKLIVLEIVFWPLAFVYRIFKSKSSSSF